MRVHPGECTLCTCAHAWAHWCVLEHAELHERGLGPGWSSRACMAVWKCTPKVAVVIAIHLLPGMRSGAVQTAKTRSVLKRLALPEDGDIAPAGGGGTHRSARCWSARGAEVMGPNVSQASRNSTHRACRLSAAGKVPTGETRGPSSRSSRIVRHPRRLIAKINQRRMPESTNRWAPAGPAPSSRPGGWS